MTTAANTFPHAIGVGATWMNLGGKVTVTLDQGQYLVTCEAPDGVDTSANPLSLLCYDGDTVTAKLTINAPGQYLFAQGVRPYQVCTFDATASGSSWRRVSVNLIGNNIGPS